MIKAAIFDLDGTLLNRDATVHNFLLNQYERLNNWLGHIQKEEYISRFTELECRGYVWKDKVFQKLIDEFKIKEISYDDLLKDYVKHFKYHCVSFPYVTEMLEELKSRSISLGLITNGLGKFQMDNIKALGIETYFQTILVSEWEGIKKPNPEIFKRALDSLGVQPNESIYVGDHPDNDIRAARAIGMLGIWKKDAQWNHADSDFTIQGLEEIPPIIYSLTVPYCI
ncbi:HAD family hydrolase [Neobacillus sp. PS2-9]|uniref:HAD family hydrolase n=1 Tax=Neobacillus sp. PS2-9 TaxID=3070676 RepID=UPI0027E0D695|nr:HAD family hydrolase [Neobacillus sp. PS2-9]WML56516.1 HAD family hydrolase [Neobacillus sp. PS2-9]